jgi:NTP pyrophosphatase (non-canonical NTP hydrolase)
VEPASRGEKGREMTLDEYQEKAHDTAIYSQTCAEEYLLHGLASEVGEVAGVKKKFIRGDFLRREYINRIENELGDVLWYLAELANEHGLSLNEIAETNLLKLKSRAITGNLKGDGDNR